jgi:SAM-dependent methyltransferase
MFRHIFGAKPSICIEDNNLKTIIKNGFEPLQKYYNEWTPDNLLWDYERIINSVLARKENRIKFKKNIIRFLQLKIYKLLSLPGSNFTWLRKSNIVNEDNMEVFSGINYLPICLPQKSSLNRILDNEARKVYITAENKLKELVPRTMAKKIPEANVQQAFVFDTVSRYLVQYKTPKILCVGSYEDTASMALQKIGINIEEIDPTQNYYLQEFATKPSVIKNSYDIIFSTSVIEHDPNDESFMSALNSLLAPGGIAIITCDYKENWKIGDDKPDVDVRLYTKNDLKHRLLSYMNGCQLVDKSQWDCPNPDFNYLGKHQYTFATFVVKKISNMSKNYINYEQKN